MADSRIDELRRRLERDPGSRLFAQLAEEYRKAGNHADAIRVARTGLAQHPAYPSARLTLGRALLGSGDAAGARVELETALREAPDNILASRFLGQALEALGELGPALLQLQKTLKMAPGDRALESQIAAIEARLRTPPPPAAPRQAKPAAAPEARPAVGGVTAPAPGPTAPTLAEAASKPPPTIKIHPVGEPSRWGRRAPGPPPLPMGAVPPVGPPAAAPPLAQPPSAVAPAERPAVAPSAAYESDVAPTLPTAQKPPLGLLEEAALPPGTMATGETVFEPEPPAAPEVWPLEPEPTPLPEPLLVPEPPPGPPSRPQARPVEVADRSAETPFSSSTLAELYLRQGLVDRAVEVYRQLLAEEPGNDRARARLAEIESGPSPAEDRPARRRALERTIGGLEALLAVVQRRRA